MREFTMSDIIKGLAIGGIIIWLATRKSDAQPNDCLQQSGQIGQREQIQIGIHNWRPLDQIQNFEDFNSKIIQPAIQHVKQDIQVEQPVSQIAQQDLQVEQPVSQIAQQDSQITEQVPNIATEYNNRETWKILRNSDGDIEKIEVERSARIDGGK